MIGLEWWGKVRFKGNSHYVTIPAVHIRSMLREHHSKGVATELLGKEFHFEVSL